MRDIIGGRECLPTKPGVASVGREAVGVVRTGCRACAVAAIPNRAIHAVVLMSTQIGRSVRRARVHDGGQGNRSRGALFARSACSRAFCDLPSQHTIGISSSCCVWATITITCVRAAMLSNVELSALLRRVMVCIRESVSIDVVCSVRALGRRERACAGPNVPSTSAIDAQAAMGMASSRARRAR